MPTISVVIVNYNVKYFLRQCLQSIYQSSLADDLEVIVVDNDSKDGSVAMIRELYPEVLLISNKENLGFSKANNQGIHIASGEYILILNPDTLLEETTLQECLSCLQDNPDAAAACVRMIDGSGNFLPESKRGFPTPLRSLFKLIGLGRIFPNSALFNGYYLGHLNKDENNAIEVLTGAFAFFKADVLKQIKGFDEDYFMYGEDIELSYQIRQAGFRIIYLANTKIIHFKGESTNKNSINYLKNFYGAMHIYAGKRGRGSSRIWNWILTTGIICSAMAGIFRSFIQKLFRPILDFILLLSFGSLFQKIWAQYYHNDPHYYDLKLSLMLLSAFSVILVFCYFIFGQYDRRHNVRHLFYGFASATLINLSLYSLLPDTLRFSRAILLSVMLISPFLLYFTRRLYNKLISGTSSFDRLYNKRVAIIGSESSCLKISEIVKVFSEESNIIGFVHNETITTGLGTIHELYEIVRSRSINELIFCSKDLSAEFIFSAMSGLGRQLSYKIANDDNTGILGSDSKDKIGQWYTLDIGFKIDQVFHRRTKRLLDIFLCMVVVVLFPLFLFFSGKRKKLYQHLGALIFGKMSWIGYLRSDPEAHKLPPLKPGVFELIINKTEDNLISAEEAHQRNLYYARNFNIWLDLQSFVYRSF